MRPLAPLQHAFRSTLVVVVSSLLVVTGLPRGAASQTRFSGEQAFRGLFFGSGPVAELFPETWDEVHASLRANRSEEEIETLMQEVASLENRLITWIQSNEPKFFTTFGDEIQSGDHQRIQDALDLGAEVLTDAIVGELGIDPHAIETSVDQSGVVIVVSVFAAVAVFALAVALLNVAVFREKIATKGMNEPLFPESGSQLQKDILIDQIASRLK